jgi:hypothetical protein
MSGVEEELEDASSKPWKSHWNLASKTYAVLLKLPAGGRDVTVVAQDELASAVGTLDRKLSPTSIVRY